MIVELDIAAVPQDAARELAPLHLRADELVRVGVRRQARKGHALGQGEQPRPTAAVATRAGWHRARRRGGCRIAPIRGVEYDVWLNASE